MYYRTQCALIAATLLLLVPSVSQAATLRVTPSSATVSAGGSISETVDVSSTDQALNAISGTISFPSNLLQVVSISKDTSVLSLWVQDPSYSNSSGTITWSGIVPNPGYQGGSSPVLRVLFRARTPGSATVAFSSSAVLANDGNGTDILTSASPATITITGAHVQAPPAAASSAILPTTITSSSHPDQTQWYKLSHAVFDWTISPGATAIQTGYDQNAEGIPDTLSTTPFTHKELDSPDGIWYFHVREEVAGSWGPIATYRVQIDTVAPLPFAITFPNGTSTSMGNSLVVQFADTDALSGIDHYVLSLDGSNSVVTADVGNQPYALSVTPGSHVLVVQAFDKAGNSATTQTQFTVASAVVWTSWLTTLFSAGWLVVNIISLILIAVAVLLTVVFLTRNLYAQLVAYQQNLRNDFAALKGLLAKSKHSMSIEELKLIDGLKTLLKEWEEHIEQGMEEHPN